VPRPRSSDRARDGGGDALAAVADLLADALDGSDAVVCLAGLRDGRIGYAGRAACEALGLEPSWLLGRRLPEVVDDATRAAVEAVLEDGVDVDHVHISLVGRGGAAVPLECRFVFDARRFVLLGDEPRIGHGGREDKLLELNDQLVVEAREGFRRAHRLEHVVHELENALEASAEKLRASFRRSIRARDEERRRVLRDLHDGAQQQLLAAALGLDLLADGLDEPTLRTRVLALKRQLDEGIASLRDIARGIYPAALSDHGIAEGIRAATFAAVPPVEVRVRGLRRYPAEVEGAVYFTCVEAIQNAVKHADAKRIVVELGERDDELLFAVRDDGRGFDPRRSGDGAGMRNVADRVRAAGGSLRVASSPGAGTTVSGSIPLSGLDLG
jgi:signal transduction histidine kinase